LLTSDEPVVKQFLNGRRIGPIGMSEEKDEATMAEEQAHLEAGHVDGGVDEVEGVPPQILATPGMPERKAVARRQARVRENLHLLPKDAQAAILESFKANGNGGQADPRARHRDEDPDTASIPTQRGY
jgi:phospholipid/cholesterol/gamma-HCH transport system ATP-binding protein